LPGQSRDAVAGDTLLHSTEHDPEALAAIASAAFAMGSRKRSADFGDCLIEIVIQPRDLLLLFAESFRVRCRCSPAGSGQLVKRP
jgi:hypothetical protein